jgi:hypothetical protein
MAGTTRLELATSAVTGQRSNQLNYVPAEGCCARWWALSDLNGRPFGCKPNALTAELSALTHFIVPEAFNTVNERAKHKNARSTSHPVAHTQQSSAPRLSCTFVPQPVNSISLTSTQRNLLTMLLARDYVGYMATEIVKRLVENGQIETDAIPAVVLRLRQRMNEELSVEDRLNDEVRQILTEHQDEMRRTGVSYQEMYKKVKGQLARDRKLVLR